MNIEHIVCLLGIAYIAGALTRFAWRFRDRTHRRRAANARVRDVNQTIAGARRDNETIAARATERDIRLD
ncbi:MAG: hypothetical protein Q8M88_12390 [Phenylobacterium sp.]|uniref:hypothetical protein n=1 Tax=Phenylobacterium sp. TaxID=1871053 RepID=UPI002732CC5A|nr:hypothetical protein [Phenylobacterium sp.]MDP3175221.1 hypothetical protein [Phenylobacterium sp.]